MPIADVRTEGSWIRVGIAAEFFVTHEGAWIKTYDEHCKRIAQMSSHNVEVRTGAGDTFTTVEGAWLKTYDRDCKRAK